jgi:hypothetical protein
MRCFMQQESVMEKRDSPPHSNPIDLHPNTHNQLIQFLCSDALLCISTLYDGHFQQALNCLSIAGGQMAGGPRSLLY